jgi:hypothetical protein
MKSFSYNPYNYQFILDDQLISGDQLILEDQVKHCYTKLVNIIGMEMYNDQLEESAESAVTWIDESLIQEFIAPGTTNQVPITFEIKNLAQTIDMENVSVTCSHIQGSNV